MVAEYSLAINSSAMYVIQVNPDGDARRYGDGGVEAQQCQVSVCQSAVAFGTATPSALRRPVIR